MKMVKTYAAGWVRYTILSLLLALWVAPSALA